jgi:hypothetical protein
MKCHQRKIRETETATDPRTVPPTLDGFTVRQIERWEAEPIIMRYEWLGTMNRFPVAFYGLVAPDGEIHGVACFGRGNGTNAGKITDHPDAKPVSLERGACVHWSHPHAPSMLVAGACRQMYIDHGYNVFFAYSDWEAGEIGTIYQACNWVYLGQAPGRSTNYRWKYRHKETGLELSSRSMRAKHALEGLGTLDLFDQDQWEKIKDWAKAKYVWFEGSKRVKRKLRKGLRYEPIDYPKREGITL